MFARNDGLMVLTSKKERRPFQVPLLFGERKRSFMG
jgi:hypothetical protein